MLNTKFYIRGAYGPGNLGDDVLMLCVIRLVCRVAGAKEIAVSVENPKLAEAFVPGVRWVPIKKAVRANIAILGGGGQFFSFCPPRRGKTLEERLSRAIRRLRAQGGALNIVNRLLVGRMGGLDRIYVADKVAAFCIGLGPFDQPGKGVNRAVAFLDKCQYLTVRDVKSAEYCKSLANKKALVFTDPSLDPSLWCDKDKFELAASRARQRVVALPVSFVVRDWPLDNKGQEYIEAMIDAARRLSREGVPTRLVSLHYERDLPLIKRFPDMQWMTWAPGCTSVEEFLAALCEGSQAIVSARAHGVLLPAALGYPTVAVAIENKLRQVHNMLPDGTILVDQPRVDEIVEATKFLINNRASLTAGLSINTSSATTKVGQAIDGFVQWLREVS